MATTIPLGCGWCNATLGRIWLAFDDPVTGLESVTIICRQCGRDAVTMIPIRITEKSGVRRVTVVGTHP